MPDPKISEAEARAKLEKEIPKPEPPAGPSEADVKAAEQILRNAKRAKYAKADYGPGKPGKIEFDLPALPKQLGQITVSNGVNGDPAKKRSGKVLLTWDEYQEWITLYEGRIRQQRKDLFGEGVAEKIMASMHLDGSGKESDWKVEGNGGRFF